MSESSEWKDIWEDEPPRYEDIYFKLGDGSIHKGMCTGFEKLRKCVFHSFTDSCNFDCDTCIDLLDRVVEWKECEEEI